MKLSSQVKSRALEVGFDLAGVAPLDAWQDLEFSRAWVNKGYAGEMEYLKNPRRADPRLILPSARSVVCMGLVYNTPLPYSTAATGQGRACGSPRCWISRYAWGRDYHQGMKARLEQLRAGIEALSPGVETRVYVDTGPIVERAFARLSGIGWAGKNTCLINQERGSWFFLGVILTSLELEPDVPAFDRCGSCTRCLEACPTGALVEPYVMDASRCIAYFNIELKGSIPAELRPAVGANVFGCDICQDVCPWNRPLEKPETRNSKIETRKVRRRAATATVPEFHPLTIEQAPATQPGSPQAALLESAHNGQRTTDNGQSPPERVSNSEFRFSLFNPRLEDLASISEDDFRRIFAHSPIKRVKYRGWLRNLCVAMGNSGDPRFAPWLERIREHPDPLVREHVDWALQVLAIPRGSQ